MAYYKWPDKDPEECLDYVLDWTDWLVTGATIASIDVGVVAAESSDTALVIDGASFAGSQVMVWLDDGTAGGKYTIKVLVRDDQVPERTGVRRCTLNVKNK